MIKPILKGTGNRIRHRLLGIWKTKELVKQRSFLRRSKSLQMVIAAMKLKDAYSLEGKL